MHLVPGDTQKKITSPLTVHAGTEFRVALRPPMTPRTCCRPGVYSKYTVKVITASLHKDKSLTTSTSVIMRSTDPGSHRSHVPAVPFICGKSFKEQLADSTCRSRELTSIYIGSQSLSVLCICLTYDLYGLTH